MQTEIPRSEDTTDNLIQQLWDNLGEREMPLTPQYIELVYGRAMPNFNEFTPELRELIHQAFEQDQMNRANEIMTHPILALIETVRQRNHYREQCQLQQNQMEHEWKLITEKEKRHQEELEIIRQQLKDWKMWAEHLQGSNRWNYEVHQARRQASPDSPPMVIIDVTQPPPSLPKIERSPISSYLADITDL